MIEYKGEMKMEITEKILEFFKKEKKVNELDIDTDLFAAGYVNSLFALQAVLFLEKAFKIKIPRKEINKENFSSVRKMADLVERIKG